jgi:DNA-binding GntR family transcriptional regulator
MLNVPDTRLALQAYDRILGMIMSGEARPGTLVNERQLGHALHMSRTPIRDALLMLEREGLLVRQGPRGLQIKQMKIEDFMNALQIRLLLEPEAARIAAGRVPAAARAELEARLRALLAAAEDSEAPVDREEVRGVDNGLHGLIAEASGNGQMAAIIRTLRRQTQIFDLKSLPERLHDTCREHLAIVGALGMQDGTRAAEAMKVHLEQVRQSIITRLARM